MDAKYAGRIARKRNFNGSDRFKYPKKGKRIKKKNGSAHSSTSNGTDAYSEYSATTALANLGTNRRCVQKLPKCDNNRKKIHVDASRRKSSKDIVKPKPANQIISTGECCEKDGTDPTTCSTARSTSSIDLNLSQSVSSSLSLLSISPSSSRKTTSCKNSPPVPKHTESLRWGNVLDDPTAEEDRIREYKVNRRKRYMAAAQAQGVRLSSMSNTKCTISSSELSPVHSPPDGPSKRDSYIIRHDVIKINSHATSAKIKHSLSLCV